MPSPNTPVETLPYELLLKIFEDSAGPLPCGPDPSLIQGPDSAWLRKCLRMRKALPLVCRTWNAPATEVLYSDIVLRRMGQITALSEALNACLTPPGSALSPGAGLSHLPQSSVLKRIRVDSLIVWQKYSRVVKEDLAYIFNRCTHLTSFEFHPTSAFPLLDDTLQHEWRLYPLFTPGWVFRCDAIDVIDGNVPVIMNPVADAFDVRLGSGLRDLDLMSTVAMDSSWDCASIPLHIHRLLRKGAGHVTSLKLGSMKLERWRGDPMAELYETPLVFPALKELYLYFSCPELIDYIRQVWVLPRLTHLTMLECAHWPEALLASHGAALRYLHVYLDTSIHDFPPETDTTSINVMTQLLVFMSSPMITKLLPTLEHLVLPYTLLYRPNSRLRLRHPTLKYLDVWRRNINFKDVLRVSDQNPFGHCDAVRGCVLEESYSDVPNLRYVRLLSPGFEDELGGAPRYHLPAVQNFDWPIICHPSILEGSREGFCIHNLSRERVVQLPWGVLSYPAFRTRLSAAFRCCGTSFPSDPEEYEEWKDSDVPIDEEMLRAVLEEQGLPVDCSPIDAADDEFQADLLVEDDSSSDSGETESCASLDEDDSGYQVGAPDDPEEGPTHASMLEVFRQGLQHTCARRGVSASHGVGRISDSLDSAKASLTANDDR
ncbi:hypothetical protein C8Q78DRAFT_1106607 [Trametes maxima]|nr:hypothetical protein C8Q78DRAFT_1106607 [Trametes maxima]